MRMTAVLAAVMVSGAAQAQEPSVDLQVLSATTPSSGVSGGSVALSATVRESSGVVMALSATARTASLTVDCGEGGPCGGMLAYLSWVLSDDRTYDAADRLVCSMQVVQPPGTYPDELGQLDLVVSGSCTLPPVPGSGTYFLIAKVDPLDLLAEWDETNNTSPAKSIAMTYSPPDFSLSDVAGPEVARQGAPIGLSAKVAMGPSGSFSGATPTVSWYLSSDAVITQADTLLCSLSPSISRGTSKAVQCNGRAPDTLQSGAYFVGAIVDGANAYVESNETNNAVAGNQLSIGLDLQSAGLTAPALAARAGAVVLTDSVVNLGGSPASFSVAFYLSSDPQGGASGVQLGARVVSGLAPGATSTEQTTWNLPPDFVGQGYVMAVIDPEDIVKELDETNNASASMPILVSLDGCDPNQGPKPDPDDTCRELYCDAALGWTPRQLPEGASCGSSDACSGSLTCSAQGICRAGAAPALDDGNPCTVDQCDPLSGPAHLPRQAGAPCSDGNVCNGLETCDGLGACIAGTPPQLEDGDACTVDACSPALGVTHAPIYGCGVSACVAKVETRFAYDPSGNLTEVIDTGSDVRHCGCEGNTCPAPPGGGAACVEGTCGTMSAGAFIPTSSDPNNCGTVGRVCPQPVNGYGYCRNGNCQVQCEVGLVPSGYQCVDLLTDPANCGALGRMCTGAGAADAACVSGSCVTLDPPVVYSVNGVAQGTALDAPIYSGIQVTGAGLDGVTRVVLEDWGDSRLPDGTITAPSYRGWADMDLTDRLHFPASSTALSIPEVILLNGPMGWGGVWTDAWYRLRLYYGFADQTTGEQPSILADVYVSLKFDVSEDTPELTSVSVIQEFLVWGGYNTYGVWDVYEPSTGFIALPNDWPSVPGQWSVSGPAPVAVLGLGPLRTELPILAITPAGIYVRAGLGTSGDPVKEISRPDGEAYIVTLVFDYAQAPADVVALGDRGEYGFWRRLRGGIILRGTGLYASDWDAQVRLEDAGGGPLLEHRTG